MPGVVLGGTIDLGQLLVARVHLVGSLLGSIASDVPQKNRRVREKLSELAIRDDERAERTETLQRLVAVLLRGVLINRSTRHLSVAAADLLCLPDEVLEKVAVVLGEQQDLGLLDDILDVGDESLPVGAELFRRGREAFRCERTVQGNIDLLIGWDLSIGKSCTPRLARFKQLR